MRAVVFIEFWDFGRKIYQSGNMVRIISIGIVFWNIFLFKVHNCAQQQYVGLLDDLLNTDLDYLNISKECNAELNQVKQGLGDKDVWALKSKKNMLSRYFLFVPRFFKISLVLYERIVISKKKNIYYRQYDNKWSFYFNYKFNDTLFNWFCLLFFFWRLWH